MGADVLLGLQWGDEGKGKIVDVGSHKELIKSSGYYKKLYNSVT